MIPDLRQYDYLLVNTSGGKDSQTTLRFVVNEAAKQGVRQRVLAVHADLSHEEWPGAKELAEKQAAHYGVPFHVVQRQQGLLPHILERGKWPSPSCRYCTSDMKRDQVAKLVTELVNGHENHFDRKIRVLNIMGMRAQESPARSKLQPFCEDKRLTNGKREVHRWLPIHEWDVADVWKDIEESGVKHHYAYDLGMPRLSCVFCIFAPRSALLLAAKHNPRLLEEYVEAERTMNHTFKADLSLKSIKEALEAGEVPGGVVDWKM